MPTNPEGSTPGRRIGSLLTSAYIFPLSQSRGKGKVLLANFPPVSFTSMCTCTLTYTKQEGKSLCLKWHILF